MTTLITGNTFPVKEQIKALGGKWDPDSKGWKVPDDKADQARKLVAEAGPRQPFVATSPRRRNSDNAPGRKVCSYCGQRDCPRAWNPRDLCQED